MTLEQLKSQAYDCLAQIEFSQNQLRSLNDRIAALMNSGNTSEEEIDNSKKKVVK